MGKGLLYQNILLHEIGRIMGGVQLLPIVVVFDARVYVIALMLAWCELDKHLIPAQNNPSQSIPIQRNEL